MEHSFFVCSATATTVYFDVSTDISTCCCFEHIIIFISYIFVGPPFGKTIHPPWFIKHPPNTCGLSWQFSGLPAGPIASRPPTSASVVCLVPTVRRKGGGRWKGGWPSAIDFFRLKHYKDFCLRLPSGYTCTRKQTCVSVFGASMLKKSVLFLFFCSMLQLIGWCKQTVGLVLTPCMLRTDWNDWEVMDFNDQPAGSFPISRV